MVSKLARAEPRGGHEFGTQTWVENPNSTVDLLSTLGQVPSLSWNGVPSPFPQNSTTELKETKQVTANVLSYLFSWF